MFGVYSTDFLTLLPEVSMSMAGRDARACRVGYLNIAHHAAIFMFQHVAVIHEPAEDQGVGER